MHELLIGYGKHFEQISEFSFPNSGIYCINPT